MFLEEAQQDPTSSMGITSYAKFFARINASPWSNDLAVWVEANRLPFVA